MEAGVVSPATSKFRNQEVGREFCEREPERALLDNDGEVFLKLAGVAINDLYQPLNSQGRPMPHLYILAIPLIGGHNPDFSGLDVADLASSIAVEEELEGIRATQEAADILSKEPDKQCKHEWCSIFRYSNGTVVSHLSPTPTY